MEMAIIRKSINLGDADVPFDLTIDVDYERQGSKVLITYCIERECPYDNPPESWYRRIEQIVEDYFYENILNCKTVEFKT
jgi:hypothetical protein